MATVDGEPARDPEADLRPYWIAVLAFAQALIVLNAASGRPCLRPLEQALATIATMLQRERTGRLAVTVSEDGTVHIGIADDDPETPSVP